MKDRRIGHLVAAGMSCALSSALAQVPKPTFYVWTYKTPQEVTATNATCATPDLKPFALLDGYNWSEYGLAPGPGASAGLSQFLQDSGVLHGNNTKPLEPNVAALLVADDVLRRTADGTIAVNGQTNEIAISMWLWGSDASQGLRTKA